MQERLEKAALKAMNGESTKEISKVIAQEQLACFATYLNVLYVEDEEMIRDMMTRQLQTIFNEVTSCANGEDGAMAFETGDYDLIISDICMPTMNGMDMMREIRKNNQSVPVIFTTAFSDEVYFQQAIELQVDRYLIKPIIYTELSATLAVIISRLYNKALASVHSKQIEEEKRRKASNELISAITMLDPDPIIVSLDGKITYVNKAFQNLAGDENLEQIKQQGIDFIFENKDGYIKNLSDFPKIKKASILTPNKKRKLFEIAITPITLPCGNTVDLITLHDITQLEYHKMKGQMAALLLSDLTKKKSLPEIKEMVQTTHLKKEFVEWDLQTLTILRRKRGDQIYTANEYLLEYGHDIDYDKLQDLHELETDITIQNEQSGIDSMHMIGDLYLRYSLSISTLPEFSDLAEAVREFGETLKTIKTSTDEKALKKVRFYISNIKEDLSSWREHIFTLKDAQNIHYLDSSLLSSCLQAKLEIIGGIADGMDDDLELF